MLCYILVGRIWMLFSGGLAYRVMGPRIHTIGVVTRHVLGSVRGVVHGVNPSTVVSTRDVGELRPHWPVIGCGCFFVHVGGRVVSKHWVLGPTSSQDCRRIGRHLLFGAFLDYTEARNIVLCWMGHRW